MKTADPIRLGVSSCLLGRRVRHDGGHKRDPLLADLLAPFVEFVPVCPELELGLGVPREAIHLARREGAVRLVTVKTDRDLTDDMRRFAAQRLAALEKDGLSGYIFKKDSPSCGMARVKIHGDPVGRAKEGVGLFAQALMARWPLLPVEEEGRLNDPDLREGFLERVFAHHRLTTLRGRNPGPGDWVRFHTSEKLLLSTHDDAGPRALGRLVARGKTLPRAELSARYGEAFMRTLQIPATPRKHVNALQHAAGHLRGVASEAERRELAGAVEDYRRGLVPLIVPITLLRGLVRVHRVTYLEGQTYLNPHPKGLGLRNHL